MYHNKEFEVTECPEDRRLTDTLDKVWVIDLYDPEVWFFWLKNCEIISRGHQVSNGIDVDASLDQQRDDNLKHLFGF